MHEAPKVRKYFWDLSTQKEKNILAQSFRFIYLPGIYTCSLVVTESGSSSGLSRVQWMDFITLHLLSLVVSVKLTSKASQTQTIKY